MELREVLEIIDGKMISTDVDLTQEVRLGGGADLMSDLLAFGQEGMLLMTGLTNPQVVRTADMAGVAAIVFVRGKIPPPETISLASQLGMPLLASQYTMFETCGRLYKAGLSASTLFETILKQWYESFDPIKKKG